MLFGRLKEGIMDLLRHAPPQGTVSALVRDKEGLTVVLWGEKLVDHRQG